MLAARSAEALELQHLLDEPESSPEFEQADALIGHLIAGSLSADRMRVLARVSGLPIGSRTLVPMMIGVTREPAKAPESSPTAAAAAELSLKVRNVIDVVRADRRIPGLVGLLRNHQTFVSRQLGPLLGRPELLSVLSTYLATSMNKVATAQLSHLSRPSLYRRLDQITSLLHVDLDDMEQVSALYVALLAYNSRPTAAPDQR